MRVLPTKSRTGALSPGTRDFSGTTSCTDSPWLFATACPPVFAASPPLPVCARSTYSSRRTSTFFSGGLLVRRHLEHLQLGRGGVLRGHRGGERQLDLVPVFARALVDGGPGGEVDRAARFVGARLVHRRPRRAAHQVGERELGGLARGAGREHLHRPRLLVLLHAHLVELAAQLLFLEAQLAQLRVDLGGLARAGEARAERGVEGASASSSRRAARRPSPGRPAARRCRCTAGPPWSASARGRADRSAFSISSCSASSAFTRASALGPNSFSRFTSSARMPSTAPPRTTRARNESCAARGRNVLEGHRHARAAGDRGDAGDLRAIGEDHHAIGRAGGREEHEDEGVHRTTSCCCSFHPLGRFTV